MTSLKQQVFVVGYVVVIIGGLAALWFRPPINDWPAWVQAVGSIAAIIAAIWIAQWQAGRERRDRIAARKELRKAVAGLARRLADAVAREADSLISTPSYHAHEGSDGTEFILLDAALDRFDPSALVSAEGILALEGLRREAKHAGHWETVVRKDYFQREYYEFDISEAIVAWKLRAEGLAQELEALAEAE